MVRPSTLAAITSRQQQQVYNSNHSGTDSYSNDESNDDSTSDSTDSERRTIMPIPSRTDSDPPPPRSRLAPRPPNEQHDGAPNNYGNIINYGTIAGASTATAASVVDRNGDANDVGVGVGVDTNEDDRDAGTGTGTDRDDATPTPAFAGHGYDVELRRKTSRRSSRSHSLSSASSLSSSSLDSFADGDGDGGEDVLPTYRAFVLPHYLLDMPLALVILLSFVLLAKYGWPVPDSPYPHRFHRSQFATGAVVWIASEAIRRRLFKFLGAANPQRFPVLSSSPFILFLHTSIQETLRLFAIHLTHFPHSNLFGPTAEVVQRIAADTIIEIQTPPRPPKGFFKMFDLALGFAGAEIIWRTLEMLGDVRLYKEVLSPEVDRAWLVGEEHVLHVDKGDDPIAEEVADGDEMGNSERQTGSFCDSPACEQVYQRHPDAVDVEAGPDDTMVLMATDPLVERSFDAYVRERKRLEFEKSYGCHLWEIPVIIIAIWRLDATLLNLTLTLFLALPYHNNRDDLPPRRHPTLPVQLPLWPTFAAVIVLHWLLSLIWTLGVRVRRYGFGLPALSYGTLLLVLSCFFASLGVWSALV